MMTASNENQPVLSAKELLASRRATGALPEFSAPGTVIFALQKSLASHVLRRHPARRIRGFLGEFYQLKRTNDQIALSTGFGIGAPGVAGLVDEFAALGVKRFVLIGMAGGLQPDLKTGGLIISTSAIRGEGVSRHYLPPAETVEASEEMAAGVGRVLEKQKHEYASGLTWTTDAPFREIRSDVRSYQNRGVLAVDMEAAAVLAVAKANGLSALALFSLADTLANGIWKMPGDSRPAQLGLCTLFDSALEYLTETI